MRTKQVTTNIIELPQSTLLQGLERLIDVRLEAKLKELGVGEQIPTRSELRVRAGFLTQRELALGAQLRHGWISVLESGKIRRPGGRSKAALERLCNALGVTPAEYIRARPDPRPEPDPRQKRKRRRRKKSKPR